MTQTNSDILRGCIDQVANQQQLDLLPKYFSEDYVFHARPIVGLGIAADLGDGEKVTVRGVHPGGPADGRLMAGDEILRVSEGQRTWETFDELTRSPWGPGAVGTSLTLWVRRGEEEHEITVVRGLIPGREMPLPYHVIESSFREWRKDWPDQETHLVHVIESGDLVAYHAENRGYNARYGRSAVWAEFGMVRVQDGKITDWWSIEDSFSRMKQLGYTIDAPPVAEAYRRDRSTAPPSVHNNTRAAAPEMKKTRFTLILVGCVILLLSLIGCDQPTPTTTPIPEELVRQITDGHQLMVLIYAHTVLLGKAAELDRSGELSVFERVGILLVLVEWRKDLGESLHEFVPPQALSGSWDNMVLVHNWTGQAALEWLRDGTLSPTATVEIESVPGIVAEILEKEEATLVESLGFDAALLAKQRQQALDRANRALDFEAFEP